MALVAGVVFFVVRALLALSPALALRHAIKKWAALAALIAAFLYLLLSGAEVATQRAFIMTAIVLLAVMLDRSALTLRNLALAALGVMLLAPQAVVHPSFQMSFAATLALIAAYERGLPWTTAGADTSLGARVALWGGREILGADPRLAGRRPRDHALRGVPLPPRRALRRAGEPAGDADRIGLGDAVRAARAPGAAVRLRCAAVAADGARHRLDDRRRACRRELRGRPHATAAASVATRCPCATVARGCATYCVTLVSRLVIRSRRCDRCPRRACSRIAAAETPGRITVAPTRWFFRAGVREILP